MDRLQQQVRDEAMRLRTDWRAEDVIGRSQGRSRRSRVGPYLVGIGGLGLVIAVVSALSGGSGTVQPASSPALSPVSPGTCEYGPWLRECPEADWARSALSVAGVKVVDETDSAFVVRHPGGEVLFWAMDPANHAEVKPLDQEVAGSTLSLVRTVEGMSLYQGSEEWGWSAQGLNVWVAQYSGEPPSMAFISDLMRLTAAVPYQKAA